MASVKKQTGYILDTYTFNNKDIPRVSSTLSSRDRLSTIFVRLGFHRMTYTVDAGLYCIGEPDEHSAVLLTANYKLSFDTLRECLHKRSAWILVLDTKGVNVWCAAGKGSFSTEEIVRQVQKTHLLEIVAHRKLVLPQLGAPGVAAHELAKQCGFHAVYGPVLASDIPAFLDAGMHADESMRTVNFPMKDRLVLAPVELAFFAKPLFLFYVIAISFALFGHTMLFFYSLPFTGAILTGVFLFPVLLPWLPGKAFSLKGYLLGIIYTLILLTFLQPLTISQTLAYCLLLPTITAFISMNFTGSSTYTSLSGVVREMQFAIPVMLATTLSGLFFLIAGFFL